MRRVYLDHNASTPVHPDVLAAMMPYFSERFGNASSIHGFGREARDGIDVARETIATFLGVTPEEMVSNHPGTDGIEHPKVRADMVFFETPNGGAVFSTGSITWAGSLGHNGYDNNVARITGNVLRRFVQDEPF